MRKIFIFTYAALILLIGASPAFAMHIMEGFLPFNWAIFWWVLVLPFIYLGLRRINCVTKDNQQIKMLLALAGAFVFVLSAMKIPSITGSSSHPTGIGLGTVMFGPSVMSVISFIVLFFQALLLAHGGISTLGANTFSMGVVGPLVAFISYRIGNKLGISNKVNVFFAAFSADILTYVMTAGQLALAFSTDITFFAAFIKFLAVFAVTQLPLAIADGLLTVLVFNFIESYNKEELYDLRVLTPRGEAE